MDGHLIYEFATEAAAQACLDAVHSMARVHWAQDGYTVTPAGIVGKQDGIDNPSSITDKWDDVHLSPDSTYYFDSLSNSDVFGSATQRLIDAGFVFTEKEKPSSWNVVGV